tara:strand:- start:2700 stop:3635 length:936 start_codon:yes stop_codon:yes gene_type:complete
LHAETDPIKKRITDNMTQSTSLVILAAGIGSRYGGIKQADSFGPSGEWLMDYGIYDSIQAGFTKVVIITRKDLRDVLYEHLNQWWGDKIEIEFVFQTPPAQHPDRVKPWGTGQAVLATKDVVKEPFAIINADDFYGRKAYLAMGKFLQSVDPTALHFSMVGYPLMETLSDAGSVARGICNVDAEGKLISVVEKTKILQSGANIVNEENVNNPEILDPKGFVSMNFWGFTPALFPELVGIWEEFYQANKNELKAEFYIPSAVTNLMQKKNAIVDVLPDGNDWMGVTYSQEKDMVMKKLHQLVNSGEYPSGLS